MVAVKLNVTAERISDTADLGLIGKVGGNFEEQS